MSYENVNESESETSNNRSNKNDIHPHLFTKPDVEVLINDKKIHNSRFRTSKRFDRRVKISIEQLNDAEENVSEQHFPPRKQYNKILEKFTEQPPNLCAQVAVRSVLLHSFPKQNHFGAESTHTFRTFETGSESGDSPKRIRFISYNFLDFQTNGTQKRPPNFERGANQNTPKCQNASIDRSNAGQFKKFGRRVFRVERRRVDARLENRVQAFASKTGIDAGKQRAKIGECGRGAKTKKKIL